MWHSQLLVVGIVAVAGRVLKVKKRKRLSRKYPKCHVWFINLRKNISNTFSVEIISTRICKKKTIINNDRIINYEVIKEKQFIKGVMEKKK